MEFSEVQENVSHSVGSTLLQRANVVLFLRVTIGCIFLLSGVGKALDIASFAETVEQYHILPQQFIIPFSILIPFAEVIFGLLFIIGKFIKTSGLGISILLVLFLVAIGNAVSEGTKTDCGCGGVVASSSVSPMLLYKDIVLLSSVIVILVSAFRNTEEKITNENDHVCLNGEGGQAGENITKKIVLYALCAIAAYSFFTIDVMFSLW